MEPIIIRAPGVPLSYIPIIEAKADASDVTEALALFLLWGRSGGPGYGRY